MNALAKFESDDAQDAVFNAISDLGPDDEPIAAAWDQLDILSTHTAFEGIEAAPGGIVFHDDGTFEAAATVYVTLNYGPSRDAVSMSDSYPALVFGHINEELSVSIDRFEADTESFYSEE